MPNTIGLMAARFIVSMMYHWQISPKMSQGLKMMKFAGRNPEQFVWPEVAMLLGFLQFILILAFEIVSAMFMCSI